MYLVIFIAGVLLGQIVSNVPRVLFTRELPEMSRADFLTAFPELKWVGYSYRPIAFFSVIPLFLTFITLFVSSFRSHGQAFVFFFPVFIIAGIGLADAFYEFSAGVTPVAYRDRATYIVHPGAHKCGMVRVALFVLVAIAAFYFCKLS